MTFECDGEKYKRASSRQKAWGKGLICELEPVGHERILDLGCGDGALTAELAALVPDGLVLGIDASESLIATATKDHAGANLRFDRKHINAMDFEPDRHRFRDAVVERMINETQQGDGTHLETFRRINVWARK